MHLDPSVLTGAAAFCVVVSFLAKAVRSRDEGIKKRALAARDRAVADRSLREELDALSRRLDELAAQIADLRPGDGHAV